MHPLLTSIVLITAFSANFQNSALSIRSSDSGLMIRNNSTETIYYHTVLRQRALTGTFDPCKKPAQCPRIHPGNITFVAFDKIEGYKSGETIVVFYWNLTAVPDTNLHNISGMTSVFVKP